MRHKREQVPVLITEAPPNPDAEFNYRRRRYAITMGIRVICLLLAAATYHIIWLWPAFAAGAVALPWIAVLLANDPLPKKASRFQRYAGANLRAIEAPHAPADVGPRTEPVDDRRTDRACRDER
ncbi:MAG: DUF3099 domain-containing protein [Mycobacteriales bacterium]